ncbi:hypothetical protein B5F55_16795 [Anaerotruncus colihominis]|nr:hypothetical protein B5F55_16795 [Anaerotruncus colihominis]
MRRCCSLTIGERIRLIRKETGLNQTDFGEKVGLRQSSLGQIESGVRNATDRTIILICEKYGVREEWLRNGTGEMFLETDSTIVSQLSSEYGLDAFEKVLIEGFLKMKPEERAVIKTYVHNLIDTLTTDETAYKEFRAEYDREHALPFAARGGDTSGLAEAAERFNSTFPAAENKDGM